MFGSYQRNIVGNIELGHVGTAAAALLSAELEEHLLQGRAAVHREQHVRCLLGKQAPIAHQTNLNCNYRVINQVFVFGFCVLRCALVSPLRCNAW